MRSFRNIEWCMISPIRNTYRYCFDIIKHQRNILNGKESIIKRQEEIDMPTQWGDFKLIAFEQITTGEMHLALKDAVQNRFQGR